MKKTLANGENYAILSGENAEGSGENMVDIHCHIVPEVDDGAWDMETAVRMARLARDCGVTKIIATPHFKGVP